ncbi:MAG: sensor histidine kinase [Sphingobacteriales bacterium]|nr:sensor histidine kinase [Sphingobacteriales bacterium]OJY90394.1 MAG: hypothetical protein BGP14_12070 [Sphingobacteriales bacterium 44-15]
MKNRATQTVIHIAGCVLFLALPFLFSPDRSRGFFSVIRNPGYFSDLTRYIFLILFFYLNYYFLIPRFYFPEKYVQYFLIVILCFIAISAIPQLFFRPPMELRPPPGFSPGREPFPRREMPGGGGWGMLRQNIFLFLAIFFFSLLLRISNRWRAVEKEKTGSELSYLKAQINPHFLFNTLNSIYALAIEKSDDTATAIVKLSAMMRYVLADAGNDYVPLEKEISYINDYVELQELRFGKAVPLELSVTGSPAGLKIAPLLLITFVENAFKYGLNAEDDAFIRIAIYIEDAMLKMQVYNRIVKVQQGMADGHGVGISNTKSRLDLLYPSRHELHIKNTGKDFTVLLTLNLQ